MTTKFDLHIHSCYSENLYGTRLFSPPSKSLPEDIIKTAIKKGIKVIAVTDHDNINGSLKTIEISKQKKYEDKIIVIPSVEVSSKEGHILAYNIYENIPRNLTAKETIKLIKEKGGFAVAAHPFNIKFSLSKECIKENINSLFGLEIANSHSLKNKYTENYVKQNNLKYTVGSDAHTLNEIGLCYGTIQKINSKDEFLLALKNGGIVSFHTHKKIISNILLNTVPGAINSFFYWKYQQICSLFFKNTFLPYKVKLK